MQVTVVTLHIIKSFDASLTPHPHAKRPLRPRGKRNLTLFSRGVFSFSFFAVQLPGKAPFCTGMYMQLALCLLDRVIRGSNDEFNVA